MYVIDTTHDDAFMTGTNPEVLLVRRPDGGIQEAPIDSGYAINYLMTTLWKVRPNAILNPETHPEIPPAQTIDKTAVLKLALPHITLLGRKLDLAIALKATAAEIGPALNPPKSAEEVEVMIQTMAPDKYPAWKAAIQ